jgi:hypothetical protein
MRIARTIGLALAAITLAFIGLISSMLVRIGLWAGAIVSGGAINAAMILGVLFGIAAWLGAVFLALRLGARLLGDALTPFEETLLASCIVGGIVVGALIRKALQIFRAEDLPPPDAYAMLAIASLPATVAVFWTLHSLRAKRA